MAAYYGTRFGQLIADPSFRGVYQKYLEVGMKILILTVGNLLKSGTARLAWIH
jgi:hypothetical protein